MVRPGVQLKSVERDPLNSDTDFNKIRPDVSIEPIRIHTQISRRIAKPVEPEQSKGRPSLPRFHRVSVAPKSRPFDVIG